MTQKKDYRDLADRVEAAKEWTWWAGWQRTVDDDGCYDIDNQPTREAVIASAMRETLAGDQFYVIEAVMGPFDEEDGEQEVQPFAETRNCELYVNDGAHASRVGDRRGGE